MCALKQLLICIFPISICFLMSYLYCEYFSNMHNEGHRLQTKHEFKIEETHDALISNWSRNIHTLKTDNLENEFSFVNSSKILFPFKFSASLKYWKQLQELIKLLYSVTENCDFYSLFSSFVHLENLMTQINRWCRYDFDEISYFLPTNNYNEIYTNGFDGISDRLFEIYKYAKNLFPEYFISFYEDYIISSRVSVISSINMFHHVIKRQLKDYSGPKIFDIGEVVNLEGNIPDVIPKVLLSFGKIQLTALIDSGCSHVLINDTQYDMIQAQYPNSTIIERQIQGLGKRFGLATGKSHPKINRISILNFSFTGQETPQPVYRTKVLVTRDLNFQIILGRSLQRDLGMIINMKNNFISIKNSHLNKRVGVPFCETENSRVSCAISR